MSGLPKKTSVGNESKNNEQKKPKRHKAYPPEFREKAVKMITELGYTAGEVARQLNCSLSAIQRWKSEARPLDPAVSARMSLEEDENKPLRKEVARLRMENARLRMENDILILHRNGNCPVYSIKAGMKAERRNDGMKVFRGFLTIPSLRCAPFRLLFH